jgi:hypothetical protein
MNDTSAEAARAVRDAIRGLDPVDRLRRALAHSETIRGIALSALRARYPDKSTLELVELLIGAPLISEGRRSGET